MNPRVVDVKPEKNYTLHVWFKNGEEGIFDVKPYLGFEMFKPLNDIAFSIRYDLHTAQYNGQTKPIFVPTRFIWIA